MCGRAERKASSTPELGWSARLTPGEGGRGEHLERTGMEAQPGQNSKGQLRPRKATQHPASPVLGLSKVFPSPGPGASSSPPLRQGGCTPSVQALDFPRGVSLLGPQPRPEIKEQLLPFPTGILLIAVPVASLQLPQPPHTQGPWHPSPQSPVAFSEQALDGPWHPRHLATP